MCLPSASLVQIQPRLPYIIERGAASIILAFIEMNMSLVEVRGIATKEKAESLYANWKKERDDWNESAQKQNKILLWMTIPISILLLCISLYFAWFTDNNLMDTLSVLLSIFALVVIPVIASMIIVFNWNGHWEEMECSWPMQYKYYNYTKDRTVLESKIENNCLELVLENADHSVIQKGIGGFKTIVRTDVDDYVVDLETEAILIPYKKN